MKKLGLFAGIVVAAAMLGNLIAAESPPRPTLVWDDPNDASAAVSSYKVMRLTGTNWGVLATVPTNAWTIDLAAGKHTLAVVAVGVLGESLQSTNKVLARAVSVVNLRVIHTLELSIP